MNPVKQKLPVLLRWTAWAVCILHMVWGTTLIVLFQNLTAPTETLWCGNSVTDPFGEFLNLGSPVCAGSVGALITLSAKGFGSTAPVVIIAVLVSLVSGVVFGLLNAFVSLTLREATSISELIWWLP